MISPLIARRHPKGRVPLMAFKTSVKAVLLSLEPELQPEPPHFFPREREREPLAERPRLPDPVAPPPVRPNAVEAEPEPGDWSRRAEEIRAMAPLLPSEDTRPLMLKIAELYAELAGEAGRSEVAPETGAPEESGVEDFPPDERPLEPPSASPPLPALLYGSRLPFPRRPLPSRR